jgi:hypothetical protein
MKISKLTITSIFPGYPDLVKVKNPETERATRLIQERIYARNGYFTENDNIPEFLKHVISSVKNITNTEKEVPKTFIG